MALTLVRHTRTLAADGLCYGRSEVALGPDFPAEAAAIAARLGRPERIVASPLVRCRRLAEHLGAALGAPVAIDDDWREMDFGAWEGRPWSAVPRAGLDAWAADFLEARPHGGESVAMLLGRTPRALAGCGGCATVAVTHAGVIRAALVASTGDAAAWQRPVGFGEIVRLDPARGA